MTASSLEDLARYLPRILLDRVARNPVRPTSAGVMEVPAAALFADVSGFTALAERLQRKGPAGIEELSAILNAAFDSLVEVVAEHGGDVLKFAGDGLLALFPASGCGPVDVVTERAIRAGLAMQEALRARPVAPGPHLPLRVGIGVGTVALYHVGGTFGRWELVAAGPAVTGAAAAERRALPGEVRLSPEASAGISVDAAARDDGYVSVRGVASPEPPEDIEVEAPPTLPRDAEGALAAYLPGAVVPLVRAGQGDWLAELRRVTVIFVSLPELKGAIESVAPFQEVVAMLQDATYRYEGSVNKVTVDDKGTSLMAAMGLPPLSHDDDPARAIRASLLMRSRMAERGHAAAVGIATGHAFCGAVGGARRREYTMLGDVVNVAARLMEAAAGGILCDQPTRDAAGERMAFEPLPPVALRGREAPAAAYRPVPFGRLPDAPRGPLLGRAAELRALGQEIRALLGSGAPRVALIEAEAGIGKSRLLSEVCDLAVSLGLEALAGQGDAVERTAYAAFRPILRRVLRLPDDGGPGVLNDMLEGDPRTRGRGPLIAEALGLEMPDTDVTRPMEGAVRADNTADLVVRILNARSRDTPMLLAIDDAHALDSASWVLAHRVACEVERTMLVVALRPMPPPLPQPFERLLRHPRVCALHLEPLAAETVLELCCRRLGVDALPDAIAGTIQAKAEGHPLFAEELLDALHDGGLMRVVEGRCEVPPGADIETVPVPDTLQGTITSRIDRLTAEAKLALKAASVLPRPFSLDMLSDVYPVASDRERLPPFLEELERAGMIHATHGPTRSYLFRHAIVQEVAYGLMLPAQRRALHARVAAWLSSRYGDEASLHDALLAHHYELAQDAVRALPHAERAAEKALRSYGNAEAVRFLESVLRHADLLPPANALRRARWQRQLGQAFIGLGQLERAREHLEESVRLCGHPAPFPGRLPRALVREAVVQLRHRAFGARNGLGEKPEELLEAARASLNLTHVHFLANRAPEACLAALRTLNLAERAPLAPELAQSCAAMTIIAGLVPIHPLARFYASRAREAADALRDPAIASFALLRTSVYWIGVAGWERAAPDLSMAWSLASELRDRLRMDEGLVLSALLAHARGDFARSVSLWADLVVSAGEAENSLHQAWGLAGQAENLLPLGHMEEARGLLDRALEIYARTADRISEITAYGLSAVLCARRGDSASALLACSETMRRIAAAPPTSFSTRSGYIGVAEVLLDLCDVAFPHIPSDLLDRTRSSCRALHRYARVFPIGAAPASVMQGRLHAIEGHPARAMRAFERGLAEASRLQMPYEEARACLEMGRCLGTADGVGRRLVLRALHLYASLHAEADADRARHALSAARDR